MVFSVGSMNFKILSLKIFILTDITVNFIPFDHRRREKRVSEEALFKNRPKAFGDFKNKQKSVGANIFWYVKMYIFWKFIQYTMHWDKTQMLKKLTL